MLAWTAACHSASPQSSKLPGAGPPALVTRMSGSGQAASSRSRPSAVVTSAATETTGRPILVASALAASSSGPAERAFSATSTPASASAVAQASPSPLLDPQTMAVRPAMPRSNPFPVI